MSTVFYFFLQSFFAPVEDGVRQCGWLCAKTADIRLFCRKNICRISGRSCGFGLHSAQFYVIIPDELNRKQQVPSAALRGGKGKREAGADPARSRHCDKGVRVRVLCAPATGALLREGGAGRRSFSQETCLLLVRGPEPQITRNWLYQKALKQQRSFCHAIRRTEGPLFSSLFPVPFVWFKPQFIQQERTRQ